MGGNGNGNNSMGMCTGTGTIKAILALLVCGWYWNLLNALQLLDPTHRSVDTSSQNVQRGVKNKLGSCDVGL